MVSAWKYYGVKLVYQSVVTGEPRQEWLDSNYSDKDTFFEESIMLVHAQSFNHAYRLAIEKARKALDMFSEYENQYGQHVMMELIEAIDCFEMLDDVGHGAEVYSKMVPAPKDTTPRSFVLSMYGFDIDNHEANNRRDNDCVKRQYVLRNLDFSKHRNEE